MTYNEIKSLLVFFALVASLGIFSVRIHRYLWLNLRRGQPVPRFENWVERTKGLLVYVGGQLRLFRFKVPGVAHFLIFWGFLFLSLTILQAILEGLFSFINPDFTLPVVGKYGPLALAQDIFAVFVSLAVIYAIYVRLVVNPERYQGSHKKQGVMVLFFILTIMLSLLVMNGIRINLGEDSISAWRPVSTAVGVLFSGFSPADQEIIGETSYWIHLGVVLIFLTELPSGKHFHVITSLPAVFLRDLEPPGRLPSAPEFGGQIGVSKVEEFRWRQLLDLYTCTECGRCQEVCPAYASGSELSPKLFIMGLRDNLKERGDVLTAHSSNRQEKAVLEKALVGEVISEADIWACTTCYACDQECPLFIEHIVPIVDLRRFMVVEGHLDSELQDALANLGRYGNSFGQSPRGRAQWTRSTEVAIKDARREMVDYLWFVGDYASYSPTLSEITRKTAEVFQEAGLDFGILYEAEQNSGNDVRRVGEEGLFELLMEKNLKTLEKVRFQTLVTTDPHSYNTLKNEYPATNGGHPVLHYTELLSQLIGSGQLKFSKKLGYTVTFQDPCYLGRYNGVYDAPRRVIEATGCKLIEMRRNKDKALCCGAGGGRIWMDEGEVKERPSEMRVREAAEAEGVSILVVACPKDVTMFQDAVKTTGLEDQLVVKDLIELVAEAI